MVLPCALTDAEKSLIEHLTVDEDKSHVIESSTRDQANCPEWKKRAKVSLHCIKFSAYCKKAENHPNFVQSLIHPKAFSTKYVAHGIKYEPVALQE